MLSVLSRLTNYQRCAVGIFWVIWLALLWIISATQAQTEAVRVLDAHYADDDQLIVYLQVLDESLSDVTLLVGDDRREMTATNDAVPVDQWVIVDDSAALSDGIGVVRDNLALWAASLASLQRIGLIAASGGQDVLAPTDNIDQIQAWLRRLRASGAAVCPFDAIDAITMEDRADVSYTTVITARTTLTADCGLSAQSPMVDVLVIDSENRGAAVQTRGIVRTVGLFDVAVTFSQMPMFANLSLVEVIASVERAYESAQIEIALTNGESVLLTVMPSGTLVPLPTVTPQPSLIATAEPDVAVVNPTQPPTEPPLSSPTSVPTDAQMVPESANTDSSNWIVILGMVSSIAVVVVIMVLMLRNRQPKDELVPTDALDDDGTIIQNDTQIALDQTMAVSIRELAEQTGPTHVANLVNQQADMIYEIHRPLSVLGRQMGSDILIADDIQISREHAHFETRSDGSIWLVRVTNNPILVNGNPIENTHQLSEGDQIQLSPALQVIYKPLPTEDT